MSEPRHLYRIPPLSEWPPRYGPPEPIYIGRGYAYMEREKWTDGSRIVEDWSDGNAYDLACRESWRLHEAAERSFGAAWDAAIAYYLLRWLLG